MSEALFFEGRVGGIEKMTMLDYPNKIAAILFYNHCNLRCPYCYNPSLVCFEKGIAPSYIARDEIINFLYLRKGVLDGIVFSGGECTVWGEKLKDDIKFVKSLGYLVKLDTNGQNPAIIQTFVNENLVDYVALDIKCPKCQETKFKAKMEMSYKTLSILLNSGVAFETRTTIHPDITNEDDLSELLGELKEAGLNQEHYIQYFFEGTDTIDTVNQHPRYFDLSKVDKRGINVVERNAISNEKRKNYQTK